MKHTYISAEQKGLHLNLRELWETRELIALFTKRRFTVSYKQTILGPLWLFINPLLSSIVYVILFGNIAKLSTDGAPQLLFYFLSNSVWRHFSGCLSGNASTFTGNAGLFGKVYFNRLAVPVSNVLSSLVSWCIQFLMVLGLMVYYLAVGLVSPNWLYWPLIPVTLVELGLMGMGAGLIVSAMTTRYRDLSVLVDFGLSLLMYASPIVYPLSATSGWVRSIVLANPVSAPVELIRYAVLGTGAPDWGLLGLSWVFTLAVLLLGMLVFNKVERTFIDTV